MIFFNLQRIYYFLLVTKSFIKQNLTSAVYIEINYLINTVYIILSN